MAAPKEYGLIKRTPKTNVPVVAKPSIFDDSSDEDGPSIGKTLKKEADRLQNKKQVKLNISNAIAEDPTVFQYDEIFEDMAKKKEEQMAIKKTKVDKKPRYIETLLKTAQTRKLDQERTYERKVQKEREAEGEEFADKDAFVTSAYKKKMLEMQILDEKNKREAEIEALNDVTKKSDLSGFYHSLYEQTIGKDTAEVGSQEKSKIISPEEIKQEPKSSSESEEEDDSILISKERVPRQFRKRRESNSSEDEVVKPSIKTEKESNNKKRRSSSSSDTERNRLSHKGQRLSSRDREKRYDSSKRDNKHEVKRHRSRSVDSDKSPKKKSKSDKDHTEDQRNRHRRRSTSSEPENLKQSKYNKSSERDSGKSKKYSEHRRSDRTPEKYRTSERGRNDRTSDRGRNDRTPEKPKKYSDHKRFSRTPERSRRDYERDQRNKPSEKHRTDSERKRVTTPDKSRRDRDRERGGPSDRRRGDTEPGHRTDKTKNSHSESSTKDEDSDGKVKLTAEENTTESIVKKSKATPEEVLEKLNQIFAKRNVGEAFEDARNRYLMRKRS